MLVRVLKKFAAIYEFFKYIVESAPPTATFYFWFSDICTRKAPLEKIYAFLTFEQKVK